MAKEYEFKLISRVWLTPTVMSLSFEPNRSFDFEPGQFLSIRVPKPDRWDPRKKETRRAYSFSNPREKGYSLCVKVVPGGVGSQYLAQLAVGEKIKATAPYGHFTYQVHPGRGVCFISTSTGIAPFLAILNSNQFKNHRPSTCIQLMGARNEQEVILPGAFEDLGVKEVAAITHSIFDSTTHPLKKPTYEKFLGRVTDYLLQLPPTWSWLDLDFYVCGNGTMVKQVQSILKSRGVRDEALFLESYAQPRSTLDLGAAVATPPPLIKKVG